MKTLIGLLAILPFCLLSLPATAQQWDHRISRDEMTGVIEGYASSPSREPRRSLGFPYQEVRAWLGVGCDADSEWAYVGFTAAPNITDAEARSGGYSTF